MTKEEALLKLKEALDVLGDFSDEELPSDTPSRLSDLDGPPGTYESSRSFWELTVYELSDLLSS